MTNCKQLFVVNTDVGEGVLRLVSDLDKLVQLWSWLLSLSMKTAVTPKMLVGSKLGQHKRVTQLTCNVWKQFMQRLRGTVLYQ
jgi:hypothetical protein